MVTTKEKRKEIVERNRRHEKDSGSPEVQVALITDRIGYLTGHLKTHLKDNHSRRGLLMMVERRRRLLKYLAREDPQRHAELLRKLDERK